MTEFLTDLLPGGPSETDADAGWQPLPKRSRALFLLGTVPAFAIPATIAGFVLGQVFEENLALAGGGGRLPPCCWRSRRHPARGWA